ncbi:MAG TPA: hypothetical protein VKU19_35945 [Bryobacteraceae bacterium]|nr:hypothetical protein [Bryobacteraceae bacterium]
MTKPAVYASFILLGLIAAGPLLKSQIPAPADRQWEYASVTMGQVVGEAFTCFASPQGCSSVVTTKVAATDNHTPMLAAAAALGRDNWELVSVTHGEYKVDNIMYFRRPKPLTK